MIRTLMWPVALYGCETWTLRKVEVDKLEAFECGCGDKWKGWIDKISNEEVLKMVDENRCLMKTVYKRKKNWIGHVLRGVWIAEGCVGGKNDGKESAWSA